jgi:TRAP-type C4-dicarboxylate transport system permease small subunit
MGGEKKMKILKTIGSAIDFLVVEISGWTVLVLTLLISVDVLLRYILGRAIPGGMEITQALLVFMVYLVLGSVEERKDHIRIDFVIDRMPIKVRRYGEFILYAITLVFLVMLFVSSWEAFVVSYQDREYYGGSIQVPIYPSRAAIVVGAALTIVALLKTMVSFLTSKEKGIFSKSIEEREIEEAIEKTEKEQP